MEISEDYEVPLRPVAAPTEQAELYCFFYSPLAASDPFILSIMGDLQILSGAFWALVTCQKVQYCLRYSNMSELSSAYAYAAMFV
jgi:hypothetical protein